MELAQAFLLCFIPLFVAIDVLSIVPIFIGLTEPVSEGDRRRLVTSATFTALAISLLFLLAGQMIFRFLGITENDFRIGGGIVLLVLSITDLLFGSHYNRDRGPDGNSVTTLGVVPLGIPLIMGPTALTTVLILVESHGMWLTSASLITNLGIVWVTFRHARKIVALIGPGGAAALSKISSLFLAAIAVMMIRIGITGILNS